MRIRIAMVLALLSSAAAAQTTVKQSGNPTPNTVPAWISSGVIGGGVTSGDSPISSFGVSNNGGCGIGVASARITAAGRQLLCIGVSDSGGGIISLQNYGTDTAQPLKICVNGTCYTPGGTIAGLQVGTTTVGGTGRQANGVLYDQAGILSEYAVSGSGSVALTASPALTGVPTAPTASPGTNTTQLATTAFVQASIAGDCTTLGAFLVGTGSTSQCSTVSGSNAVLNGFANFSSPNAVWSNSATGANPTLFQMAAGSNASPISAITPTVGISRNEATSADAEGGQNAALFVNLISNNTSNPGSNINAQGNALTIYATQNGNADQVGIFSNVINNGNIFSGRHYGAIGIFAQATASGTSNNAVAINPVITNSSGSDCSYSTMAPDETTCAEMGIFLQSNGANLVAAGMLIYKSGTGKFDVGYAVQSGSVNTASFISQGFQVDPFGRIQSTAQTTVASATGATLDDVNIVAETSTFTGTTTITQAHKFSIYGPTFTNASADTLSTADTLYVDAAPNCTGSFTCTNTWAIRVGGGNIFFPGSNNYLGTVANNTIWNGTKIGAVYGGTNIDSSASTGVAQVAAGTWSVSALALSNLATQATNTVVGNATSGSAAPTALAVGSCSTASSALNWTTNTGFGCNTSITAAAVPASGLTGATLASGVTASSLTSLGTLTALTVNGQYQNTAARTIASAGSVTLDDENIVAETTTFTGTTAVTTAQGFNKFSIYQPTYGGTAVAVTNGATLYIAGPPLVSGSVTLTNALTIGLSDQSAQSIGMWRQSTASTAGKSLTISSSGGTSGGSNLAAGAINLTVGPTTGTAGTSTLSNANSIIFNLPNISATTGSTDNAPAQVFQFYNAVNGFGTMCAGNTCSASAYTFQGNNAQTNFNIPTNGTMNFRNAGSNWADYATTTASTFTVNAAFTASNATVIFSAITTDSGKTDRTICQQTSNGQLFFGSGTLGICLGTSGRQFKTDFEPMSAGLDDILKLKLWNYRYRKGFGDDGDRMQYGSTAQDVEEVLPDLVRYDSSGNAINYDIGALLPVALHAVQQLKTANDNLQLEIEQLKRNRR